MNTKKIIMLSFILIFLILILAGLGHAFSFIVQSYNSIFYDFGTGESANLSDENLKLIWSWYDSYYILSIIAIILLSSLIILVSYLFIKEIVYYYKQKKLK